MKILLINLEINNFKSFVEKKINFLEGRNVISGRNESGKTTVADAFFWLLFGKDSQFRTKFDVKRLDSEGNEINNLTTSVKAFLVVDDKPKTYTRVLEENWVTKRGETESKLAGNITSYFIDEIPVKKSEFDGKKEKMIAEEDFKLLTSNTFFNEQLEWKERRKILSSLIKNVTYEQLVDKRGFSIINKDIKDFGIEKTEDKYKYQIKGLNKELISLPARIDEVSKNINNSENSESLGTIKSRRSELNIEIQNLRNDENFIDNDFIAKQNDLQEKLNKVSAEIQEMKEQDFELINLESNLKNLKLNNEMNINRLSDLESDRVSLEMRISSLDGEKGSLRTQYVAKKAEIFPDHLAECPTCGQNLPTEMAEKAKESFQAKKESALSNLVKSAESINLQANRKKVSLLENAENIENLKNTISANDEAFNLAVATIEKFKTNKSDDSELLQKRAEIKEEMNNLKPVTVNNSEKINEIQADVDDLNQSLSNFENSEKAKIRVEQLTKDIQEINKDLVRIQQQMALVDDLKILYIKTTETDINNLFDRNLSVKMFETQINGGFKETCEIMVKSKDGALVPYKYANTAGKINAGLQVINSLSKHKNIACPVFIDNTESVGSLFQISGQTIELKMIKTQKDLKIN